MFDEYSEPHDGFEYPDDADFPDDPFELYDEPNYAYYDKLYRDIRFHQPRRILNLRDNRFFPGIKPAGIDGISPKLRRFITGHVNRVAYHVQGPPPSPHESDDHFP